MKKRALTIVSMTISGAALLQPALGGSALAFHNGGVAHCDGCHSMHNSTENEASVTNAPSLLKGSDASSTCLNCHAGGGTYHVASADGTNMSQGGDFYWVKTSYTYGDSIQSRAENHGHSINAADYGFTADSTNLTAGGGTYSASLLGCTSCHDAHGQVAGGTKKGGLPVAHSGSYGSGDIVGADGTTVTALAGNYRLLGDNYYTAGAVGVDDYRFSSGAPVAVALNGPEGGLDSSGSPQSSSFSIAVDYGRNMSRWCVNCHRKYDDNTLSDKHPIKFLGAMYSNNYNKYIKAGDFTGDIATAYDPLVPFERGTSDLSLLDPTSTAGADAASVVMCLTCHRTHASAFDNMGKWDFGATLLAESSSLLANDLPATAVSYYGHGQAIDIVAEYGVNQRSLCNKCHVQD